MTDFLFPPVRPEIMNQTVASLSVAEIERLPAIVREYEAKMEEWLNKNQQTAEDKIRAVRESVEKTLGFADSLWADTVWKEAINNTPQILSGASNEALHILQDRYTEYAKLFIKAHGSGRKITTN